MNNQLEKQIVLLREKLGHLKIPSRDGKILINSFYFSCSSFSIIFLHLSFCTCVSVKEIYNVVDQRGEKKDLMASTDVDIITFLKT